MTKQQAEKLIALKDSFNYLTYEDLENEETIEQYLN